LNIEQGILNYEVEIAALGFASLAMTPEPRWIQGRKEGVPGRGEPPAVQGAKNLDSCPFGFAQDMPWAGMTRLRRSYAAAGGGRRTVLIDN